MNKKNDDFIFSIGSRHPSKNCGWFRIIKDLGIDETRNRKFRIKFENTEFETDAYATNIKKGEVKDPYAKTILGVACIGCPKDPPAIYKRDYNRWNCMINRCYNPSYPGYTLYGALGVSVCERWLCFEYYYDDMKSIPNHQSLIENPDEWKVDRIDNIPKSELVYSTDTFNIVPKNKIDMAAKCITPHQILTPFIQQQPREMCRLVNK